MSLTGVSLLGPHSSVHSRELVSVGRFLCVLWLRGQPPASTELPQDVCAVFNNAFGFLKTLLLWKMSSTHTTKEFSVTSSKLPRADSQLRFTARLAHLCPQGFPLLSPDTHRGVGSKRHHTATFTSTLCVSR